MYNIAICDDEVSFVTELEGQIKRYIEETGTELRITVFKDGMELVENYQIEMDLIFLDIQMKDMDGLQAAKRIREMDSKVSIIFLTSLVNYVLEGYKYQASNYIIKPMKYVRLKAELDKWLSQYKQNEKDYIIVTNDSGKYKVFLNTLHYIETYQRNVLLHTDEQEIISYKKMKEFETELKDTHFVRCHASYLVNLYFVKRVEKLEIELTTGESIPISQPKRKMVMENLADYWGDLL